MSNIGNKYKVGVFVIVAAVLLIISLSLLGVMDYFKQKYIFMTVLDSSVQGLEVGAQVKLKGVTIGRVNSIQIGHQGEVVYVYMEFLASSLKTDITRGLDSHSNKYAYFKDFLNRRVKEGLRCQLHYSGITGTLYQELKKVDPVKYPDKKFTLPKDHPPYIPSVTPILMGDIIKNLNKTLSNVAKLDLSGTVTRIEKLADDGMKFLESKGINEMVTSLKQVMSNLDTITGVVKENIDRKEFADFVSNSNIAVAELNKTLVKARGFMKMIEQELKSAELKATTDSARNFMDTTESTLQELRGSLKTNLENLTTTINSANATLESARHLLNSLEQNPTQVLYGKDGKRIVAP